MATPTSSRAPSDALPVENGQSLAARRTSLGFLRRSKSTEPLGERKPSGSRKKMSKTQAMEEELRRQRESYAPKSAPRLPDLSPTPQLETFGGEERDTLAPEPPTSRPKSGIPVPTASMSSPVDAVDPYARTESMTHRGRYSYASSAVSTVNNPRRIRRRKDPTPYNVLVVGARNSGKTSFLNFLRKALTMPPHKHPSRSPEELEELERQTSAYEGFTSQYLETEIDGERVGLTLWDSTGLERNIVDLQMRAVTGFLESKFEETLAEEMKVVRSPGARDTHIHCTFLLLDPVRLDENIAAAERIANGTAKATDGPVVGVLDQNLDLQVLRTILGKTTIVPVISKADTITSTHMGYLRKAVWNSLKQANIDPLEILTLEDQEEYTSSESADEEESVHGETLETPAEPAEEASESKEEQTDGPTESKSQEAPEPSIPQSPSQRSQNSLGASPANPHVPFSILSPDPHSLASGEEPVGRRFPWGFADPYDPEHCDFVRLKDSVFSEWRAELRDASRVIWYERWRTNRLNRNGQPTPLPSKKSYAGRMGPIHDGRRTR
ncbi:Putative Septin [Penicillium brasilianum]|uniref:Putative Septin n=1 Tax=Penicillium brasilianum TaxID=104259 RepID=A0A0F7TKM4_PENBI|nr:Putative Septin [Penicillium brasilianum]